MIEIHPDTSSINASGTIPVTWCVPRDIIAEAAQNGLQAHLQLCVVAESTDGKAALVTRQVEPLKAGMAYVSFHRAGTNRIFGRIFFGSKEEASKAHNAPGIKWDGTDWRLRPETYEGEIAEFEEKLRSLEGDSDMVVIARSNIGYSLERSREMLEEARVEERLRGVSAPINVPAECFGKEWPRWVIGFLSYLFKDVGTNQCDRRKRAIIGFAFIPLLLAFNLAFRICAALVLGLGIGIRNVNYRSVIKLYSRSYTDVWQRCDGFIWTPSADDDKWTTFLRPLLMPLFVLPLFVASLLLALIASIWKTTAITELSVPSLHWWLYCVAVLYGAALTLAAGAALVLAVLPGVGDAVSRAFRNASWPQWLASPDAELQPSDLDLLACPTETDGNAPARRPRPTIWLRYTGFKAKVCKPLQR